MKTKIIAELKRIAKRCDGIIQPEVVVQAAKAKKSPLHECFCWDDSDAAHQYRIWQARQLIRVSVEVMPNIHEPIDVFVSLSPDRKQAGGGYRIMSTVLSDKELREQMLADALNELGWFQQKYARLEELANVFKAINTLRRKTA